MSGYNWAEILKGTRALNYSLRGFEALLPTENDRVRGLSLPDTRVAGRSREQWLEKCDNLEQKTVEIFTPELMAPFGFSNVMASFVYGLIREMRHKNESYKGYMFDFDLDARTVSSALDFVSRVREVHSDEDRLVDVFEANGWTFKKGTFE